NYLIKTVTGYFYGLEDEYYLTPYPVSCYSITVSHQHIQGAGMTAIALPPLTKDLVRVLIDADTIQRRVSELAQQINKTYAGMQGTLILVGVLKGSFIFLADLCRKLEIPHVVDFISLSSYASGSQTTGNVRMIMDTRENMEGRHVMIVEDILDSGYTLDYLCRNFLTRKVASLRTAVLLDKPERRKVDVKLDYVGFQIPDVWVVGYGLDYAEKYRTLPYIAEMVPVTA
ncbi:MAG: hypoxanthine phosphoribosyltransferase, partial [Sphaerochaetaceae bacterium]